MKKILTALFFYSLSIGAFAITNVGDVPFDDLGKDINGNVVHISDYQGKVVIVTFWATWCHYCMQEIPVLENIQKQAGTSKLQVIAVSHGETMPMFKKVCKALPDIQSILSFDKGNSAKKYDVKGIPHMII